MRKQLEVGDKLKFVSGNFYGLTGVVTELNFDSKDKNAIYGYLHTVKLSNGKTGGIEKSEHWRYI
tara:strand:- start:1126 stop:1320 length:195 start_codon:yes stop_codon:yes gene_type:complete